MKFHENWFIGSLVVEPVQTEHQIDMANEAKTRTFLTFSIKSA
jgi:hypothetical protein